jgi:hypothetical protein
MVVRNPSTYFDRNFWRVFRIPTKSIELITKRLNKARSIERIPRAGGNRLSPCRPKAHNRQVHNKPKTNDEQDRRRAAPGSQHPADLGFYRRNASSAGSIDATGIVAEGKSLMALSRSQSSLKRAVGREKRQCSGAACFVQFLECTKYGANEPSFVMAE